VCRVDVTESLAGNAKKKMRDAAHSSALY
jgi:hypothetical protein